MPLECCKGIIIIIIIIISLLFYFVLVLASFSCFCNTLSGKADHPPRHVHAGYRLKTIRRLALRRLSEQFPDMLKLLTFTCVRYSGHEMYVTITRISNLPSALCSLLCFALQLHDTSLELTDIHHDLHHRATGCMEMQHTRCSSSSSRRALPIG